LNLLNWKSNSLDSIKTTIVNLVQNEDIKLLCDEIDKISLHKLYGNDTVNHKEVALVTTFYDAFIYTFASNQVFKEYTIKKKKIKF